MRSPHDPRRPLKIVAWLSVFTACACLCMFPAVLGQHASSQTPSPTFRTEANYVRVDVFPSKDGVPVTDLAASDFEVREGGVPQRIEQFERVLIRGNVPQELRVEPNTLADSRHAAQNSRARVFVVFLDTAHVSIDDSHKIRQPLVDALNTLIGPDDVFAVMTPEMSARDIVFARKTTSIERMLARYWTWGERNEPVGRDPQEQQYVMCYPGMFPTRCSDGSVADDRGIADTMIERRREKMTLEALTDLVRYLRGAREERKAVIAISDGWRLLRRDDALMHRQVSCTVPAPPPVTVDPRTGRLTGRTPPTLESGPNPDSCEPDRISLGAQDDEPLFRALVDEANRSNTSFYPIDPRGLVVLDEPIAKPTNGLPAVGTPTVTPNPDGLPQAPGPSRMPLAEDDARAVARRTSLQTLAANTDGVAIVNANDLNRGFKRIVDDLSAYYLVGYYSTGKLDGKFHPIAVRVNRPGIQVRARRGYLAATPADTANVAAARGERGTKAVDAAAEAEARAIEAAIAPLPGYARDLPLRLHAASGWTSDNAAFVWAVGELSAASSALPGGDADVTLVGPDGTRTASAHASLSPGVRAFRVALRLTASPIAGEYTVRVRARAEPAAGIESASVRIALPAPPDASGALYTRRSSATLNKEMPTADLRFRRTEQLRVEIPASSGAVAARLLDRAGKPLSVPVAAALRDDGDGLRWASAQVTLAPLAAGDYVIEIAAGDRKTLAPFRVVP